MTRRHENYSEKTRQIELFNFKDIQNYYAAKLLEIDLERVIEMSFN